MIEIQCPKCEKITRLEDATPDGFSGELRVAIDRGERPKIVCFQCWREQDLEVDKVESGPK